MILGFWISLFVFLFSFLVCIIYNTYSYCAEYIPNLILGILIALSIFLMLFFGYYGKI